MLFQVVAALVPATINYSPQSSLAVGTHEAEYNVSNIIGDQQSGPCVFYLLKSSGEGQVTLKNVIFYTNLSRTFQPSTECEQINFTVFLDTNFVLQNVTITGIIDITYSSSDPLETIEKKFVLAIFTGTESDISITDGLQFRLNKKNILHRKFSDDADTHPDT